MEAWTIIITLFENLPVSNDQKMVAIVAEKIYEVDSNFGKIKENYIVNGLYKFTSSNPRSEGKNTKL